LLWAWQDWAAGAGKGIPHENYSLAGCPRRNRVAHLANAPSARRHSLFI